MNFGILKLPRELLDIIIDHLHDDEEALFACSLVSRDWVPPSHYHLFSSLRFTATTEGVDLDTEFSNTDPAVARIESFLSDGEPLWPLVRELEVGNDDEYTIYRNFGWGHEAPFTEALLTCAVEKLPNLDTLIVRQMPLSCLEWDAGSFASPQRTLKELMLMDLQLTPWSFTRLLERFSTIDRLVLLHATFQQSDTPVEDPIHFPSFKEITIDSPYRQSSILDILPRESVEGTLETFSMTFPSGYHAPESVQAVRRILELSAPSLSYLHFNISRLFLRDRDAFYTVEWPSLCIDECTALETLHVSMRMDDGPDEDRDVDDMMGQWSSVTSLISLAPPCTRRIIIGLVFGKLLGARSFEAFLKKMLSEDFGKLDDALEEASHVESIFIERESLADLESRCPGIYGLDEQVQAVLLDCLPRTAASGRLNML